MAASDVARSQPTVIIVVTPASRGHFDRGGAAVGNPLVVKVAVRVEPDGDARAC